MYFRFPPLFIHPGTITVQWYNNTYVLGVYNLGGETRVDRLGGSPKPPSPTVPSGSGCPRPFRVSPTEIQYEIQK